jgi:hypothetical protein
MASSLPPLHLVLRDIDVLQTTRREVPAKRRFRRNQEPPCVSTQALPGPLTYSGVPWWDAPRCVFDNALAMVD